MTTSSRGASGRGGGDDVTRLADAIVAALRERPLFFMDLVRTHRDLPYRTLLRAWGAVRDREKLERDEEGHYFLPREGGEG
jgi:hypothetical protein